MSALLHQLRDASPANVDLPCTISSYWALCTPSVFCFCAACRISLQLVQLQLFRLNFFLSFWFLVACQCDCRRHTGTAHYNALFIVRLLQCVLFRLRCHHLLTRVAFVFLCLTSTNLIFLFCFWLSSCHQIDLLHAVISHSLACVRLPFVQSNMIIEYVHLAYEAWRDFHTHIVAALFPFICQFNFNFSLKTEKKIGEEKNRKRKQKPNSCEAQSNNFCRESKKWHEQEKKKHNERRPQKIKTIEKKKKWNKAKLANIVSVSKLPSGIVNGGHT